MHAPHGFTQGQHAKNAIALRLRGRTPYARAQPWRMASDSEASMERGDRRSVLLLGGTGRIGTAVASHLILPRQDASLPPLRVVLAGRSTPRGDAAVQEVVRDAGGHDCVVKGGHAVDFMALDYTDAGALRAVLRNGGFSAVVNPKP